MNCLFGGDFFQPFFAMSINRCMQCGCKSSLGHIHEKLLALFFISACVMLVLRCEPTKPHEHSAGYSFMAWFFWLTLAVHFSFRFDFNWHFCGHPQPSLLWYSMAFSKSVRWWTMNICVSASTHYPFIWTWKTFEMFAICKVDNWTSHFKLSQIASQLSSNRQCN